MVKQLLLLIAAVGIFGYIKYSSESPDKLSNAKQQLETACCFMISLSPQTKRGKHYIRRVLGHFVEHYSPMRTVETF
ncbi:hypothetical protein A0H81_13193 [Grifola frondosa]|uniref:Uncharacterized protein n=1 Tax=Grifola frondosa TaxID=5627 RepID=A0A1C7LV67_GRIFR|nr:hypothetical protein A0H81_13193 [Grifola frondosa]